MGSTGVAHADVVVVGVGWVGTPEEFPSWAERHFRSRASPKPLGARR